MKKKIIIEIFGWTFLIFSSSSSQQTWNALKGITESLTRDTRIESMIPPNWQHIGPGTNDILDFAFNRMNPNVIYAASRDSGVFKTIDGGLNWNQVNNGITDRFIRAIESHPRDSNIVLAGTFYEGLFRTTDGGNNWSRVTLLNDSTILSITFDGQHPDTIYVGTLHEGVYRSIDAGVSWQRLTSDTLGLFALKVFIDPSNSDVLYYISPDNLKIYKSLDFGSTWITFFGTSHIISFALNPLNASTIFMGNNPADRMYRTRNSGASWERLPLPYIITDLVVNPLDTNHIYASTPGWDGVYVSTNSGTTWDALKSGLSTLTVIRLKLQPNDPSTLYASTNGGALYRISGLLTNVVPSFRNFPEEFLLAQNYPNPFNPSTTISYQLQTQSNVTLKVFDVLGREVATLLSGVEQPGYKSVNFDARSLSSGIYYYRLQAGNYIETKKLLLIR
jgi:photosystem II stability/assembly factor-like uncharacterized protein